MCAAGTGAYGLAGDHHSDCVHDAGDRAAGLWGDPDSGLPVQSGAHDHFPGDAALGDCFCRHRRMDTAAAGNDYYGCSGYCGGADRDTWIAQRNPGHFPAERQL